MFYLYDYVFRGLNQFYISKQLGKTKNWCEEPKRKKRFRWLQNGYTLSKYSLNTA